MNLLARAGLYWTINTFIWSYLSLVFLPLLDILRLNIAVISEARVCAQSWPQELCSNSDKIRSSKKLSGYFEMTLMILLL